MQKITDKLISWASILEENTEAQARTAATMPFIYPHLALMPDAHLGRGATVGSVIPTLRAVMPAAVGVDIGCGMIAVRTQFGKRDIDDRVASGAALSELRQAIERAVPTSAGAYNRKIVATAEPRIADLEERAARAEFDPESYARNWRQQLGSLGAAITSSRSVWTRPMRSGCSCTPAAGASATRSPPGTSRSRRA